MPFFLLTQMVRREILGRYRGSFAGLAWSLFNPLLMLIVYTIVFGSVFQSRWPAAAHNSDSRLEFGLILFAGLIPFNLFAETISRAPTLVTANPNYVTKVIFPLYILPLVSFGAAAFHAVASLFVLLAATWLIRGNVPATALLIPVVWLPLILLSLGLGWLFASLGVFFRDLNQGISILVTVLMFMSPLFYPSSALPQWLHDWLWINPLLAVIESTRAIVIWGEQPAWRLLAFSLLTNGAIAALGLIFFQRSRAAFPDVI